MSPTRRTFLKQMSAAATLGIVGQVPGRLLWAMPTAELIPEPDEALLRELALTAVDAARTAGATFGDVRVVAGRAINFSCGANYRRGEGPQMGWPELTSLAEYGIRTIVDGAWGFAGGTELTTDAVRRVAQKSVGRARGNRPRRPRTLDLAPVPQGQQGTWETPIEQDPFLVPLGEQADIAFAALAEARRVDGIDSAGVFLLWSRHLRVFASSEDALIVQRISVASPRASTHIRRTEESPPISENVEALRRGPYGYEALTSVDLNEELRQAGERAVAESRRPVPPGVDVGRYDIVFGASAITSLLVTTIAPALNLERALGYHANRAGTSFAAPPMEVLGQLRVGSPLLTVKADRNRPGGAATVGWDDEGVQPVEHTLVRDGIIADYSTNRQTAAEIAGWYRSQGQPARSHGCASGAGSIVPAVRLSNLTMEPGPEDLSVDDLIADTKRGFYIEAAGATTDQQLLDTQGPTAYRNVHEIRDGKIGDRARDLAFRFITPSFWQRIDAIGGASSMVSTVSVIFTPRNPLQLPFATVDAVPARVRDVNVMNFGRSS